MSGAVRVVQAAIEQALAARSQRTQMTGDRVVEELTRIAFSDLSLVATWSKLNVCCRVSINSASKLGRTLNMKLK